MTRYCVPLVFIAAIGCASSAPTPADRIADLGDPDDGVRMAARFELSGEGKAAEPCLLEALGNPDSHIRYEASAILRARASELGTETLPYLERAAADSNGCVRSNAVQMIGYLGPQARSALPTLYRGLRDTEPQVQRSAMLALGKVQGAEAVPVLTGFLQDPYLKYTAALTLERLGPSARTAIPALEALAREDDEYSRRSADDALSRIRGPQACEATVPVSAGNAARALE